MKFYEYTIFPNDNDDCEGKIGFAVNVDDNGKIIESINSSERMRGEQSFFGYVADMGPEGLNLKNGDFTGQTIEAFDRYLKDTTEYLYDRSEGEMDYTFHKEKQTPIYWHKLREKQFQEAGFRRGFYHGAMDDGVDSDPYFIQADPLADKAAQLDKATGATEEERNIARTAIYKQLLTQERR